MKGNYITFYNFGVLREAVHQILAGEGLIFRGLARRILRAQIQSEIRGPQIITIYFEVKRFTRMKLFDNWGTAPMFIDVQTNILHYYFGVPPSPWTNSLCEFFWKRSRTKVPNNTTPHTTQNKKTQNIKQLKRHKVVGTTLPKLTKVRPQANYFGVGVGTQTSKESSATIFNHQGKASGKASHELVFGWIGATHDPNQIKLKPPHLISHHKKNAKHQTTQAPQVCRNYPSKKHRNQASSKWFFWGVEFQCALKMLTVEHSCSKKCAKQLSNASSHLKWYHFRVARVSLCHMPAQENLKSKIPLNHPKINRDTPK